jgi:hypothetical protein
MFEGIPASLIQRIARYPAFQCTAFVLNQIRKSWLDFGNADSMT